MPDGTESTEWRVDFFPEGMKDGVRTFTEEQVALAYFDAKIEEGSNPILSKRTIIASDWSIVKNSVSWDH